MTRSRVGVSLLTMTVELSSGIGRLQTQMQIAAVFADQQFRFARHQLDAHLRRVVPEQQRMADQRRRRALRIDLVGQAAKNGNCGARR